MNAVLTDDSDVSRVSDRPISGMMRLRNALPLKVEERLEAAGALQGDLWLEFGTRSGPQYEPHGCWGPIRVVRGVTDEQRARIINLAEADWRTEGARKLEDFPEFDHDKLHAGEFTIYPYSEA